MRVSFDGMEYVFDLNKHQRVELHKGWDQYGNGSISLYGAVTPYNVLEAASYKDIKKIVLIRINENKLVSLHTELDEDCSMEVLTYQNREGREAVQDSLELILNAVCAELQEHCNFEIKCTDSQMKIHFLQAVDIAAIMDMLQKLIQMNLPLRKLLMQVCSAKEILEYTKNTEAFKQLKAYDDYDSIILCQCKKYYGLAKSCYVETSGWFTQCSYHCKFEENSFVISGF